MAIGTFYFITAFFFGDLAWSADEPGLKSGIYRDKKDSLCSYGVRHAFHPRHNRYLETRIIRNGHCRSRRWTYRCGVTNCTSRRGKEIKILSEGSFKFFDAIEIFKLFKDRCFAVPGSQRLCDAFSTIVELGDILLVHGERGHKVTDKYCKPRTGRCYWIQKARATTGLFRRLDDSLIREIDAEGISGRYLAKHVILPGSNVLFYGGISHDNYASGAGIPLRSHRNHIDSRDMTVYIHDSKSLVPLTLNIPKVKKALKGTAGDLSRCEYQRHRDTFLRYLQPVPESDTAVRFCWERFKVDLHCNDFDIESECKSIEIIPVGGEH